MTHNNIRQKFIQGLTKESVDDLLMTYGKNQTQVPIKPIFKLLVEEFINIFNVFQLLAVVIWYLDAYGSYATIILVMSIISISIAVYETRKNAKNLNTMSMFSSNINVWRNY